MKKLFLALTFMAMALTISAQSPLKYGYFSFSEALKAMPGYAVSERDMAALRAKYDEEGKRVEDDFNKKYEQFLDGQRDFAPLILQKRQAELQEMMEKNVAFKNESKRLLDQADAESKAALKVRLRAIVARIGAERGYAFILNTDNDAVPYVNNIVGEDINALVKDAVKR
ncbi:OmpH family outer membrane protein [Prevotella salivae]|uniref:OmpH family outer membrane protein n=1 Tax=Segatella salivae TaxID=228604 RepID=UPI001C5DDD9D|nr:OmpH family outer membrane protein [Segatella salivae]MBW4763811.1 OmpH family outer membrane protein [Segatella salivae]